MLAELYVENFALIENLQVTFYHGLNIISGETGAGKSLLTDAVGLLMGGRADKEFIGFGSKKALVEGTFVGPFSSLAEHCLQEAGFLEDEVIISREIHEEGANLCRINGRRVSLGILKEIVPNLMNLHSQTEHFTFLKDESQLALLDHFGGDKIEEQKQKLKYFFFQWRKLYQQRCTMEKEKSSLREKEDFLAYRIEELSTMELKADEDCILREEINLQRTATKRLTDASFVCERLSSAMDYLYESTAGAKGLSTMDSSISIYEEALNGAYYSMEDVRDSLVKYRDNIEVEPFQLDFLEQRLSAVEGLKKKYKTDVNGLIALLASSKEEIQSLENFDVQLDTLLAEEKKAENALNQEANLLTSLRQEVGKSLSQDIMKELWDLMLPHAMFSVELSDGLIHEDGKDVASFFISMNRGEELKPLSKVASGGEISRILLGLKVILGKADEVQTMIFDEIDSGMSGKAAGKVGEKLECLAENTQVFAVTHSPIVAAKANHHYYIEKMDFLNKTVVQMKELEGEGIRKELARMISGDEKSKTSLQQAEELLKK